jgi:hypothetical protein
MHGIAETVPLAVLIGGKVVVRRSLQTPKDHLLLDHLHHRAFLKVPLVETNSVLSMMYDKKPDLFGWIGIE